MPVTTPFTYEFSTVFDKDFLLEVHDNDLYAIAEIFDTARKQITNEIELSKPFADLGDSNSLRQRFHRIKPLWGFAGLHFWQQHVQVFEDFCSRRPARENLIESYERLIQQMEVGLDLLELEATRLKTYLQ